MDLQGLQVSMGPRADMENRAAWDPLECPETKAKRVGMASLDLLERREIQV